MNEFKINDLKINNYFSDDAYTNNKSFLLFSKYNHIDEETIKLLKKWKLEDIYSKGSIVKRSKIQEVFIDKDTPNIKKIDEMVKIMHSLLNKLFNELIKNKHIDKNRIANTVSIFLKYSNNITEKDLTNILYRENNKGDSDYLIFYTIKAFLLSNYIANVLKITRHNILNLGISTLLQDIGILYYFNNPIAGELKNEEDLKKYDLHPVFSCKILGDNDFENSISHPVLLSHMKNNKNNFNIKIENISNLQYAKILAVSNKLIDTIEDSEFITKIDYHELIFDLILNRENDYDSNICHIVSKIFKAYPADIYISMLDKTIYKVLDYTPNEYLICNRLIIDNGRNVLEEEKCEFKNTDKNIDYILTIEDLKKLNIKDNI